MKQCRRCYEMLQDNEQTCHRCGAPVPPEFNPQGQQQQAAQGPFSNQQGQQYGGQGQTNNQQGPQYGAQGQPHYQQGQPNYQQGQPNYQQGQPNYQQGQPQYGGQGQPYNQYGQQYGAKGQYGQPQYGMGQSFDQNGYYGRNNAFDCDAMGKSRGITALLAIFLGALGIQYFYLGKTMGGVLTIILSLVTCGLWEIVTLIQGILMLTMSNQQFDNKFVYSTSTFPLF